MQDIKIRRPAEALAWTGERLTSDAGQQVRVEHYHRYFLAQEYAVGLDVLDVASGEGYGSSILADVASRVVGVDLDADSVSHAMREYARENLSFLHGDAVALPLDDDSFDLIVSFETIEHLSDHDQLLAEFKRVLRPGGTLIISSPNVDVYTDINSTTNPYHVRELTLSEFSTRLSSTFAHVLMCGQSPIFGSTIMPMTASTGDALIYEKVGDDAYARHSLLQRPVYFVAIASDRPLQPLPHSLFVEGVSIDSCGTAIGPPAIVPPEVVPPEVAPVAVPGTALLEAQLRTRDQQIKTLIERQLELISQIEDMRA